MPTKRLLARKDGTSIALKRAGMNRKKSVKIPLALGFCFFLGLFPHLAVCQDDLPKLVKTIQPAIVTVIAYDSKGKLKAQGSGFFINQEGHFITNYHVLEGASRAEVKTFHGWHHLVRCVLAENRHIDLILAAIHQPASSQSYFKEPNKGQVGEYLGSLDINMDRFDPPPPPGIFPKIKEITNLKLSSTLPEIGERVAVVGSPMGLEQTLSEGVVSAIRHIPEFGEILQITAPISRGSSGSPVVNMKGEVVGIATFLLKEGQNLNFAIPGSRALALKPSGEKTLNEWRVLGSEPLTEAEVFFLEGDRFFDAGKLEKAIEAYKQVVRLEPDCAEAHINIGQAYYRLGRYQKAAEAFKITIRLEPQNTYAHCRLGHMYLKLKRYKEAVNILKQTIRLDPELAVAHCNLGVAYNMLGRDKEAAEAFKQAVRLKPAYGLAHYNLGLTHLYMGNTGAALEQYKILKDLDPKRAEDLFNQIYR